MRGRDLTNRSYKDEILIISISQASLDAFSNKEPGIVRGDLKMLRKMGTMVRENLGLE